MATRKGSGSSGSKSNVKGRRAVPARPASRSGGGGAKAPTAKAPTAKSSSTKVSNSKPAPSKAAASKSGAAKSKRAPAG
ncbi:MAG TPA: hypothetical protein VJP77_02880, partial [Planctomycetota bacterium]|nr:hypothetical protein [Planctomycetota bacterium]